MLALIAALTVVLAVLFSELKSNYYTRVKALRRFIKPIGKAPEYYLRRSTVSKDIAYNSVFPYGTLDIYTASDSTAPQPVVLWIHGGGYVGGDKSCIKAWAHVLAYKLKAAVVSVNYCLAPEQHYPVPIIQICEALAFLSENSLLFNLDTSRIFLGGDSAGAQIASQFACLVYSEKLRQAVKITPPINKEQLRGILLCCGFYNMETAAKSRFPAIKTFLWAYTHQKRISRFAGKDDMSAVKNLDSGYCDVYLTCGNSDPFLGQAQEFYNALAGANIPAEVYFPKVKGKRLKHEYQFRRSPEADTALYKAVSFIEKRL